MMRKMISFSFNLSRKEVEDMVFEVLCKKYDSKDIDFEQAKLFDSTDYTFDQSSTDDFLNVTMDVFDYPLRRNEKPLRQQRKRK